MVIFDQLHANIFQYRQQVHFGLSYLVVAFLGAFAHLMHLGERIANASNNLRGQLVRIVQVAEFARILEQFFRPDSSETRRAHVHCFGERYDRQVSAFAICRSFTIHVHQESALGCVLVLQDHYHINTAGNPALLA